jgi:hypothetical protein
MSNTLQRLSSSLGIAVLATFLAARLAHDIPAHAAPSAALVSQAFGETFWISAATVLLALPAALTLRRAETPGGRPDRLPAGALAAAGAVSAAGAAYFLLIAFGAAATPFSEIHRLF